MLPRVRLVRGFVHTAWRRFTTAPAVAEGQAAAAAPVQAPKTAPTTATPRARTHGSWRGRFAAFFAGAGVASLMGYQWLHAEVVDATQELEEGVQKLRAEAALHNKVQEQLAEVHGREFALLADRVAALEEARSRQAAGEQ